MPVSYCARCTGSWAHLRSRYASTGWRMLFSGGWRTWAGLVMLGNAFHSDPSLTGDPQLGILGGVFPAFRHIAALLFIQCRGQNGFPFTVGRPRGKSCPDPCHRGTGIQNNIQPHFREKGAVYAISQNLISCAKTLDILGQE